LVEYKKEGNWKYYKNYNLHFESDSSMNSMKASFDRDYSAFSTELFNVFNRFGERQITEGYDSIEVKFLNNEVLRLIAVGKLDYAHFVFDYFDQKELNSKENLPNTLLIDYV
jgi:hypothetical protein